MHPYFSKEQQIGFQGEIYAAQQLQKRGFTPRMPPNFCAQSVDLMIDALPVEVKFSHQKIRRRKERYYPKWQWKTQRIDTADRVLILIAEDVAGDKFFFVMPGHIMAHRDVFEINSHPTVYRGIIAPFLDNWLVVDFLLNQRYRNGGQLTIFQ